MTRADVQALRDVGLDDAGVLHVVTLAAWFNYINRVADGLGIQVDPHTWEKYAASPPIPWERESASTRPQLR